MRKSSERQGNSSGNNGIEEDYSEEGFEEESLGNSQLNVAGSKTPVSNAWGSSGTGEKKNASDPKRKMDGSSNFSDADGFEDNYDDDFL